MKSTDIIYIENATPEWVKGFLVGAISMREKELETAEGADHERAVRAIAAYEKAMPEAVNVGVAVDKNV